MKLIIAEKPSVAGEIAKVVGATKNEKGFKSGADYLVTWCVGHLIELAPPEAYDTKYKKWDLVDLPILPDPYRIQVTPSISAQYQVVKDLMQRDDVSELIVATDAGREGELIFRLVYEKAGCQKPYKRLWISSMEEKAIRDGLDAVKDSRKSEITFHRRIIALSPILEFSAHVPKQIPWKKDSGS